MELFTRLFGNLLAFVYHCFDRMVINGYLSGLSRPEQVVYFLRQVLEIPVVSKETLSQRTNDYRDDARATAARRGLKEAWIKCASRWTKTGYQALAPDERATYRKVHIHQGCEA